MAVELKGDLKRALGITSIKIGELELEFSSLTPKMMLDFYEVIKKANGDGNSNETVLAEYFINFFKTELPNLNEDEVNTLVTLNITQLTEEFMILFKMTNREDLDDYKSKQVIEAKMSKSSSPIVG